MTIREKIVARANSLVGKSRDQVGCSGVHAWCAHFVSKVLEYCGVDMFDLSCSLMYKKMSASPQWEEPSGYPIPGDILLFDWDHIAEERPLDHVGIVVDFNKSTNMITYVNGNGSSSTYVTKQTINVNNSTVSYWMRYIGSNATNDSTPAEEVKPKTEEKKSIKYCTVTLEELSKGCESASVETMQNLLVDLGYNIDVDGKFGNETAVALMDFQRRNRLSQDAICGSNSWKALIESV